MTVIALGVGSAILAWVAVVIALAGAIAAVALLARVVQPAFEIDRYAKRIDDAAADVARSLERGADELARTRELATSVPPLASAYLARRGGGALS